MTLPLPQRKRSSQTYQVSWTDDPDEGDLLSGDVTISQRPSRGQLGALAAGSLFGGSVGAHLLHRAGRTGASRAALLGGLLAAVPSAAMFFRPPAAFRKERVRGFEGASPDEVRAVAALRGVPVTAPVTTQAGFESLFGYFPHEATATVLPR